MPADELCTNCKWIPCTACSFTRKLQDGCDYKSYLRLFYAASRRGVWSIGSKYILKDRESDPPDYDPQNTRFLRTHTSIPVPNIVLEWDEPGNKCMRLVERVEGRTLADAWPHLSESEKRSIAKETCEYLAQLRGFHSSQIESLDHGPIYNAFLFAGGDGVPHGPLKSDDELWDSMAVGIKKMDERIQQFARDHMPKATPYTFTHGELSYGNIIVKDGKVTGILDWERSGYMPRWWEFVATFRALEDGDAEWKELLREYMEAPREYEDALRVSASCQKLEHYPDLDDEQKKVFEALKFRAGVQ